MPKILLVEDEPLLRESYRIVLEAVSHEVDSAANGLEALRCCRDNIYDLILLDLMMPKLDGIGFLKKFQKNSKTKETRIIVLSNMTAGDKTNQALKLGAHKYVQKSQVSPTQLIKLLRTELAAA